MSQIPNSTPSIGSATAVLGFPEEQVGVREHRIRRPGVAPMLAKAALEAPPQRSPAARRAPGVYDAMGQVIVAELSLRRASALRAIDPRINYIASTIPGPDHTYGWPQTRNRATVREVTDGRDAFRRFVVPALARNLLAYMLKRNLIAVDVFPVVSAIDPIDVAVPTDEPYGLRRRVRGIAQLLAIDRRTARTLGEVTSLRKDWLKDTGEPPTLPLSIVNPLTDETRWAHQDLTAGYPKLADQINPMLLVYGTAHADVEQAYALPRTTS